MKASTWLMIPLALALTIGLPVAAVAAGSGDGHGDAHAPPINWFNIDYAELDAEGHKLEPGAKHSMAPPLGLAIMNFAAFFMLLVWKGGPPISNYLRSRHTSIKEALEEGKRLREEAAAQLEEYGAKIKGVEAEVDALIADVRASAEGEKKRIIEQAEAQAELMRKNAEAQIAAEVSRARAELETEVMKAALAAAEALLRDKATNADHQKLIDGFLVDLADAGAPTTEKPA